MNDRTSQIVYILKFGIRFGNYFKIEISGHRRIQDFRADRGRRESDPVARAARHLARRGNAREGTRIKREETNRVLAEHFFSKMDFKLVKFN